MARRVDADKYAAKRGAIAAAASRLFATTGYDGTSTAAICREASVSSGTFFHYFPTKLDVLVAVLDAGVDELRSALAAVEDERTGLPAILAYAERAAAEMADPGFATFVGGMASVENDPRVAATLADESATAHRFVLRHVTVGQEAGDVRGDVTAEHLATWIGWIVDGAATGAATRSAGAGSSGSVSDAIVAIASGVGGRR